MIKLKSYPWSIDPNSLDTLGYRKYHYIVKVSCKKVPNMIEGDVIVYLHKDLSWGGWDEVDNAKRKCELLVKEPQLDLDLILNNIINKFKIK